MLRYAGQNLLKADPVSTRRLCCPGYAKDVLVEPEWLEQHLNDESIRIVEVNENPALYADAHIPGAIGLDWKQDLQDQVRRDFLGPEAFGRLFASHGVSDDHTIVLYGDRNNWFAAYTYWYLKYYGHDKVLLLNGPREKWIADGRPTSAERPSYTPASFTAQPGDDTIRARRDEVLSAIDGPTRLVNVRSPAEFAGEIISPAGYEQEGAQRAGHIPGAASVPWAQAVREDGTFRSADELRDSTRAKEFWTARRSSPTAGSESAPRTPGSCCTSCSAPITSRTTTAPGRSGAALSASRSRPGHESPLAPAGPLPLGPGLDPSCRRAGGIPSARRRMRARGPAFA